MINYEKKTLKWINQQREKYLKYSYKELNKISTGYRWSSYFCPISNSLSEIGHTTTSPYRIVIKTYTSTMPEPISIRPPWYVKRFIRRFDMGKYPHLRKVL